MAKIALVPDPAPPPQNPSVWGMRGFQPSETKFRTWRIDFEYWICLEHQCLATLEVRQRWPVALIVSDLSKRAGAGPFWTVVMLCTCG